MKWKTRAILAAALLTVGFGLSAYAGAGSVERGKAPFNDPDFANGTRACSSCHPDGSGLERAGSKQQFSIMGGSQDSLEEAVNACIVNANKGEAISTDSRQMQDVVAYIKSLGK